MVVIIISLLVVVCSCSSSKHTTTSQYERITHTVDSLSTVAKTDIQLNQLEEAVIRIETTVYDVDTIVKEKRVVTIDYRNQVKEQTRQQEHKVVQSVTSDTVQATATDIIQKDSNFDSINYKLLLVLIIAIIIVYHRLRL